MGQGQEVIARKLMAAAAAEGQWLLLQNTHLGLNYLTEVEQYLSKAEDLHEDFRWGEGLGGFWPGTVGTVAAFQAGIVSMHDALAATLSSAKIPANALQSCQWSIAVSQSCFTAVWNIPFICNPLCCCRLWVTAEPHPQFPIGLLQMGIKITNEAPVGMKAGLRASYQWVNQDMLDAVGR
jgi:hypothetical protein